MLESQGLRPFDPYRTLLVHPHASGQLIGAAYWTLVERWKARALSIAAEQALADLNAAYQLLLDPEARRAYDDERGFTELAPPRIHFSRKHAGILGLGGMRIESTTRSDYYHLLRVDPEADAEIIEIAHAVLRAQLSPHSVQDQAVRELLNSARDTLCDPQLRASYDATLRDRLPASPTNSPDLAEGSELAVMPPTDSPVPDAVALTNDGDSAAIDAEPIAAPSDPTMPVTFDPLADAALRARHLIEDGVTAESLSTDVDGTIMETAPSGEIVGRSVESNRVAEEGGIAVKMARDTRSSGGILRRLRLGPRLPAVPRVRQSRSSTDNPQRLTARDVAASARDERLLTLRITDDTIISDNREIAKLPELLTDRGPMLIFVAGPLAGSRVSIDEYALTLGSDPAADVVLPSRGRGVAPQHARIWRHGRHSVFRRLEGVQTEICGRPMPLPLVILEDGDEIGIGQHRMRFVDSPDAKA